MNPNPRRHRASRLETILGVGQSWCGKDRQDDALRRLTVDPHSPMKWRVNGALRNTPEFAEAFQCKDGSQMKPAAICEVW